MYSERGGGRKGEQLNNQVVHTASWPTPLTADAPLVPVRCEKLYDPPHADSADGSSIWNGSTSL
jgi:hypothetical protein